MQIKCNPALLPKPKLEPSRPVRAQEHDGGIAKFGAIPQKEFREMLRRAKTNRKDIWNDEELGTLTDMYKQGYSYEEIALHIPTRTQIAIESKLRKMRKRGEL